MLVDILSVRHRLLELAELSQRQRFNFAQRRYTAWIANLSPDLLQFDLGVRSFLESYYAIPAKQLGFCRWGFKEVRYDLEQVMYVLSLFPEGRAVFLFRSLEGVLASNAANDWYESVGGPQGVTDHWVHTMSSFSSCTDSRILMVDYSDLTLRKREALNRIETHLALGCGIDETLLENKVRGAEHAPVLTARELEQLARKDVKELSAAWKL